jgi:SAM-dependent methyltransferase
MRDYYEDLWGRLPEQLDPPDLELRLGHLRAGVRSEDRVLDLGSGDGRLTQEIAGIGAKPVGVEVAQAAVDRARAGHPELDFRLVPIDGPLPFDDGSFEVVWSSEVIEHVADTARWMSEVRRVLVPRGTLLLTTPSHGRLRLAAKGIEAFSDPLGDHLHLYSRASLQALLAEFGFSQISVRTAGGPPLWRRLLLARASR